ncbi:MAG: Dihydroorotate dehydrogenase (quinone) [Elusimicrobia bacterium]|nr:Dihydroorotate dehydrogenase (quinone) [Elusimicrobiota bacterium]
MGKPFLKGASALPNPIQVLYKNVLQRVFFGFDAETAHNLTVKSLRKIDKIPGLLDLAAKPFFQIQDERLRVSLGTLTVTNPVGLAAGFDKNAELLDILPYFGFGFIEVGTFTPLGQKGQARPRLFRLKNEQALLNRMGFNNPGVKIAADHLKLNLEKGRKIPVGVNIGKGRDTDIDEAADDYLTVLEHVYSVADYVVLNVSSPNTPNLRTLQKIEYLERILRKVVERARLLAEGSGEAPKLIFTKVSPDCSPEELEEIARLSVELRTGLVATNTSVDYSLLKNNKSKLEGGLSGRPIKQKANEVLKKLRYATKGVVPLIGVGGIFSAEDAYEKIRLGASVVQVYTGWVYKGPSLVSDINKGLLKLLKRDGFKSIKEAVGTLV